MDMRLTNFSKWHNCLFSHKQRDRWVSFKIGISNCNIHDLTKLLQQLGASRKGMLAEVLLLGKILKVMPATNAVSERPVPAKQQIESYDDFTCA